MRRLGVITGLRREAACLVGETAGQRPLIACAAADSQRAREGARRLISEGAEGLLSFGIAGGLDPQLRSGAVVIADAVLAPGGQRFDTAADWRRELYSRLSGKTEIAKAGLVAATIAGSDILAATPEAKRQIRTRTMAAAIDMESHAVAETALEAGIPFLAVRAVADPARTGIPLLARDAVTAGGDIRGLHVLTHALIRPWQWSGLWASAVGAGRALASLRRVAAGGGPGLGFG